METVCNKDSCVGCHLCEDICPKKAIKVVDEIKQYNAYIDSNKCVNCGICHKNCQINHPIELMHPKKWYEGWASDSEVRYIGSSGGIATAIIQKFIKNNGIVYACSFSKGNFNFERAAKEHETNKFTGSKYVKSNPKGIYLNIKKDLVNTKVLFIGLPCQVGALKKYIGDNNNLYTIDLICHGTPSIKILANYLKENKKNIIDYKDIKFRCKSKFNILDSDGKAIVEDKVIDKYIFAFLNCVNYTNNCYECKYATINRVSDLTLGDSWGTGRKEELKNGVSLMLVQTSKGEEMLDKSNLVLKNVDLKKAIEANHQLESPSKRTEKTDKFFDHYLKNNSLNKSIVKCFPKAFFKRWVKRILINLHILSN